MEANYCSLNVQTIELIKNNQHFKGKAMIAEIWNFITGNGASVIAKVESAVDEYFYTDEEMAKDNKAQAESRNKFKQRMAEISQELTDSQSSFKLEVQRLINDREKQIHDTYKHEINASKEVIVAELQQSDNFTKRARPTVIYAGLLFILLEMFGVRIGILNYFNMSPELIDSSTAIFNSFLYMWGAIAGAYALGRSAEKRGISNTVTKLATGNQSDPTKTAAEDIETRVKRAIKW